MTELKHSFGAAKMNKDLDERTVPNGEYRDALNIEIVTSENSDAGTVQTLLGNELVVSDINAKLSANAKVVGSIANEKNNKIYYFIYDSLATRDYIIEYNSVSNTLLPVVVDIWQIEVDTSGAVGNTSNNIATNFLVSDNGSLTENLTNIRPGMTISGSFNAGLTIVTPIDKIKVLRMKRGTSNDWEVWMDDHAGGLQLSTGGYASSANTTMLLRAEKTLNFTDSMITGINIIGDELYWTDGKGEPKKINISICKIGTDSSALYHTKLPILDNDSNTITFEGVSKIDFRTQPAYLSEEHITVIKKSPLSPPTLVLSNTLDGRIKSDGTAASLNTTVDTYFINHDTDVLPKGFIKDIQFNTAVDYKPGDVIVLRRFDEFVDAQDQEVYEVVIEILEYSAVAPYSAKVKIMYVEEESGGGTVNVLDAFGNPIPALFYCTLKQEQPLYEFKFPKFAYRYKYENGNYSCYSPFSEPAFLPGEFDYVPKEGYNLGMVNTLRSVYIMDFVEDLDSLPKDVVEIDILYKESNSNTIYTVKSIKTIDDEWNAFGSPSTNTYLPAGAYQYARTKGALRITTEMVRSAVTSNQILRPWDNVPRSALAQELVGNRIVYANYLQNYNIKQ